MHFALSLQAGLSSSAFAANQKRYSQKLKIETYYFKLSDPNQAYSEQAEPSSRTVP
jgi:hypothetical protein